MPTDPKPPEWTSVKRGEEGPWALGAEGAELHDEKAQP